MTQLLCYDSSFITLLWLVVPCVSAYQSDVFPSYEGEVIQRLCVQLNFVNTDSDNTDSRFTRTNFFSPGKSPWFYIQLLMDNTDSANADFRLTQTTFSTRCHQNTSVNTDCVAVWTPELRPVGYQLFTEGSYYNYAGRSNGTSSWRNEM